MTNHDALYQTQRLLTQLSSVYGNRWYNNGPGHPDNDRLHLLQATADDAATALSLFLIALTGKDA